MKNTDEFTISDWSQFSFAFISGRIKDKNHPEDLDDIAYSTISTKDFYDHFGAYDLMPYPGEFQKSKIAFFNLIVSHPNQRIHWAAAANTRGLTPENAEILCADTYRDTLVALAGNTSAVRLLSDEACLNLIKIKSEYNADSIHFLMGSLKELIREEIALENPHALAKRVSTLRTLIAELADNRNPEISSKVVSAQKFLEEVDAGTVSITGRYAPNIISDQAFRERVLDENTAVPIFGLPDDYSFAMTVIKTPTKRKTEKINVKIIAGPMVFIPIEDISSIFRGMNDEKLSDELKSRLAQCRSAHMRVVAASWKTLPKNALERLKTDGEYMVRKALLTNLHAVQTLQATDIDRLFKKDPQLLVEVVEAVEIDDKYRQTIRAAFTDCKDPHVAKILRQLDRNYDFKNREKKRLRAWWKR